MYNLFSPNSLFFVELSVIILNNINQTILAGKLFIIVF